MHGLRKGKNLGDRIRYESPQEEDDEDILAHTGDDKERIALGELLHLLKTLPLPHIRRVVSVLTRNRCVRTVAGIGQVLFGNKQVPKKKKPKE